MTANRMLMAELGAGYRLAPASLLGFRPSSNHVVIQEKLYDDTLSKLILLRKGNATLGTVLAAGPDAREEGIQPGDLVAYDEWQGGRWAFPDANVDGGIIMCLVMRADFLLVRVPREDAPQTRLN